MLGIERKQQIIKQLKQNNKVLIKDLSNSFNVTEETIRRDIKELVRKGIAIKSHGGALLNPNNAEIKPFIDRELTNRELKDKIALQAIDLICDGMVLMVDASTTTKTVIERLSPRLNITIITNSYTLINDMSDNNNFKFIATGGECAGPYRAFVGSDAMHTIRRYNVDLALLSCHSLSLEHGFMESNQLESDVKCAMAEQAIHTVMLADHTKFDQLSLVNSLTFNQVETLVTDCAPNSKWLNACKKLRMNILYPELEEDETKSDETSQSITENKIVQD